MQWRPTATVHNLKIRADILAKIRSFFAARGVLEVETPLLSAATVSDTHLSSVVCRLHGSGSPGGDEFYLQTSPEFAMKRLLAAGSGDIFQISKAFRDGESGRLHNPEFTMLEWYRVGFDHHRLMDEVEELLAAVLDSEPATRTTFRQGFLDHVRVDPITAATSELRSSAASLMETLPDLDAEDRDGWLNLLHTVAVEPHLGRGRPTFVFDYPASQAALARISPNDPRVAERFEVYVEGLELANGYHELTDPDEQRRRFDSDRRRRVELGLPAPTTDEHLLEALESGLPPCAGVALGIDRLMMLAAGAREIREVITFPIDRA